MVKGWFKVVSSIKDTPGMFKGCFKDALQIIQERFTGMFEGCFNDAFLILQLGLMNASIL